VIWYQPIGIAGLRRLGLSRSAVAMVALHVMPPSLAAAIQGSWDIFP
jgi:hypothetical protein